MNNINGNKITGIYDREIANFYKPDEREKVLAVARATHGNYAKSAVLVLTPEYLGVHHFDYINGSGETKTESIWALVNIEEVRIDKQDTRYALWIKSSVNPTRNENFIVTEDSTDFRRKIQEFHKEAKVKRAREEVEKIESNLNQAKEKLDRLSEQQ